MHDTTQKPCIEFDVAGAPVATKLASSLDEGSVYRSYDESIGFLEEFVSYEIREEIHLSVFELLCLLPKKPFRFSSFDSMEELGMNHWKSDTY